MRRSDLIHRSESQIDQDRNSLKQVTESLPEARNFPTATTVKVEKPKGFLQESQIKTKLEGERPEIQETPMITPDLVLTDASEKIDNFDIKKISSNIKEQSKQNSNFIFRNFSKPEEKASDFQAPAWDQESLKNTQDVIKTSSHQDRIDTPQKNFGESNFLSQKTTNFEESSSNNFPIFDAQTVTRGQQHNVVDLMDQIDLSSSRNQVLSNQEGESTQINKIEAFKSGQNPSENGGIDTANIGRRTFKKQNRSTVVESSSSFSRSRQQSHGIVIGNVSQEKAPTLQNLAKDENIEFNTIREEEEIPFNPKVSQNTSPITPNHFQLSEMPDFGDLSAVNHLSKILDTSQENVIIDRQFHCDVILEDGQEFIRQDSESIKDDVMLVRLNSDELLRENMANQPESQRHIDPEILEKSLSMTKEMIMLSKQIDSQGELNNLLNESYKAQDVFQVSVAQNGENSAQPKFEFADDSKIFKPKDQLNQDINASLRSSKPDPFDVFDIHSPQKEEKDHATFGGLSSGFFDQPNVERDLQPQGTITNGVLENNFFNFSEAPSTTTTKIDIGDFMNFEHQVQKESESSQIDFFSEFQSKEKTVNTGTEQPKNPPKSENSFQQPVGFQDFFVEQPEHIKIETNEKSRVSQEEKSKELSLLDDLIEKSLNESIQEKRKFDEEVDQLVSDKEDPVNSFRDLFF